VRIFLPKYETDPFPIIEAKGLDLPEAEIEFFGIAGPGLAIAVKAFEKIGKRFVVQAPDKNNGLLRIGRVAPLAGIDIEMRQGGKMMVGRLMGGDHRGRGRPLRPKAGEGFHIEEKFFRIPQQLTQFFIFNFFS
jgi:hypothetical protein